MNVSDSQTVLLGETQEFSAWQVTESDGATTYHLELDQVTLHFFQDEWDEFLGLIQSIVSE